jgi:hypothetical protein
MLLDANTVTDHVTVDNAFDAQSIHYYITNISMHSWPGVGHFQSDFSDQFHFKAQIARNQQFMPIRSSCLAVIQILGCKCISCDGEFANALLTVTAVTPHTFALRVQTQATSDDFLSHNARMFRLEFFANTHTAPPSQVREFTYYFSHLHLLSVISTIV